MIKKGVPPTILFHGRADTVVPYATAELFAETMTNAGNECTLHGYKGRNHGFFNSPQFRSDAMRRTTATLSARWTSSL